MGQYEQMKRRVWAKYEPKLRALAKDRELSELATRGVQVFTGVKPDFEKMFEDRLREIHRAIIREINALPKTAGEKQPEPERPPAVLNKLPVEVRKFITDSIGQRGIKITDQATLKWMGDVVSKPRERMPSIRGAGVEFTW